MAACDTDRERLYALDNESVSWSDFTQKTTFHGVKYIFADSQVRFRRPIWMTVVLLAIFAFLVQVGIRTGDYWNYETSIGVSVTYKKSLGFPAVTICNQNTYRMTATVKWGLYDMIDEVYKAGNDSELDWGKFASAVKRTDVKEFSVTSSHQKLSLIDSCSWNGAPCNIESDFGTVITDLGVCYTFNGAGNGTAGLQTKQSGAGSGLQMVINVEQYEYMRGPQNDAGIKILLHSQDEVPLMKDSGFAAAPGTHTFVAMQQYQTDWMEPPYGNCVPNNPPITHCLRQCETAGVIRQCNCRAVYMNDTVNNATKQCDLKLSLSCIRKSVDEMQSQDCACNTPPCHQTRFEPQLSYAQLSKFNIARMILDKPEKQHNLQTKYYKAREAEQRYRQEIIAQDQREMNAALTMGEQFQRTLANYKRTLGSEAQQPGSTSTQPDLIFQELIEYDMGEIGKEMFQQYGRSTRQVQPMTDFVKNITSLQTEFLECSAGGRSAFYDALVGCVDGTDGSGGGLIDPGPELGLVLACMDEAGKGGVLRARRQFYNDMASTNTMGTTGQLSAYKATVSTYFNNLTKIAALPTHVACLQVLADEHQLRQEQVQIDAYGRSFAAASTAAQMVSATRSLVAAGCSDALLSARGNLTACMWLKAGVLYYVGDAQTKLYKGNEVNSQLHEFKQQMHATIDTIARRFDAEVVPLLRGVSSYIDGNITKADLSAYMTSPKSVSTLKVLALFQSDSFNAINSVQSLLGPFVMRISSMYRKLGDIRTYTPMQMKLFQSLLATNRTDLSQLISGLQVDIVTNTDRIFELIVSEYDVKLQAIKDVVPAQAGILSKSLSELHLELVSYAEAGKMDVGFFMENFLQVDIFYKDMSFESSTQQAAFSVASLFGEVGGFMGLLLGASILTICELIDYIMLGIIRTCRHRKQVQPSSSILKVKPQE